MKTQYIRSVFVVLFAAFICAGCFISIPAGPGGVPIILQNMFVVLAACILGGFGGMWAAVLFAAAGAIGLPVYAGAAGGFVHLIGPTGGFIIGYIPAALAAGLIARLPSASEKKTTWKYIVRITVAAIAGYVILYIPGVLWFMHVTQKALLPTLLACVVPFIPGDIIKLIVTVPVAAKIRPAAAQYISPAK